MVERADITQVLAQMRAIQAQMQRPLHEVGPAYAGSWHVGPGAGLRRAVHQAIDSVNAVQQASTLPEGYEVGRRAWPHQVMVAAEKSSVA
jgi:flagellar hook-basal body complex protein FliE